MVIPSDFYVIVDIKTLFISTMCFKLKNKIPFNVRFVNFGKLPKPVPKLLYKARVASLGYSDSTPTNMAGHRIIQVSEISIGVL